MSDHTETISILIHDGCETCRIQKRQQKLFFTNFDYLISDMSGPVANDSPTAVRRLSENNDTIQMAEHSRLMVVHPQCQCIWAFNLNHDDRWAQSNIMGSQQSGRLCGFYGYLLKFTVIYCYQDVNTCFDLSDTFKL